MRDYARQACQMYEEVSGLRLKPASTPFLTEGSLTPEGEDVRGELATSACSILMKLLWLGRLARPDIIKAINDLATKVQQWSRNCDRRLHRLVSYVHGTSEWQLRCFVGDPAEQLRLRLYADADFAGDETARSTSGGYLVVTGPSTWYPIAWLSKRQTSVSRSTTEAEVVSLAYALFQEALPALSMLERILSRDVVLEVREDNEATIKVIRKGYSPKLRHIQRTHKVNLASLSEVFQDPNIQLDYVSTLQQVADLFTKAIEPAKWQRAVRMLGIEWSEENAN